MPCWYPVWCPCTVWCPKRRPVLVGQQSACWVHPNAKSYQPSHVQSASPRKDLPGPHLRDGVPVELPCESQEGRSGGNSVEADGQRSATQARCGCLHTVPDMTAAAEAKARAHRRSAAALGRLEPGWQQVWQMPQGTFLQHQCPCLPTMRSFDVDVLQCFTAVSSSLCFILNPWCFCALNVQYSPAVPVSSASTQPCAHQSYPARPQDLQVQNKIKGASSFLSSKNG